MKELRTTASMEAALQSDIASAIRELIAKRMSQLGQNHEGDLGDVVHFIIIEPGDQMSVIEKAVGFSLLVNLVDGTTLGDDDFVPSFEWLQDHGSFFELVYLLTDDGFGTIVLVHDHPGIEFDVHMLCLEYAGRRY